MTYRLIAILLLIFLQGCDSRVDSLQAENKKLKAEVSALAITNADSQLEIEYMASEASFAAGCDYLIAVCPGAAVETGRKALSSGYGGNGGWFWLAFILKLLAIGAVSGGCVGVALWLWYCAVKPAKSESDDAQKNIDQAGEKIAAEAATRLPPVACGIGGLLPRSAKKTTTQRWSLDPARSGFMASWQEQPAWREQPSFQIRPQPSRKLLLPHAQR